MNTLIISLTANRSTQLQVAQQGSEPSSQPLSLGSQLLFSLLRHVCSHTVRCHPQISTSFPSVYQHTSQSSHLGTLIPCRFHVPSQHSCLCSCYWLCPMSFLLFLTEKTPIHPQSPVQCHLFSDACPIPILDRRLIPSPSDPIASCLYYTMS